MSKDLRPGVLRGLRLPRWLLPAGWPVVRGEPALADLFISHAGTVTRLAPHDPAAPAKGSAWHLGGALALPGFVDAHTHIDKTFTLPRMGEVRPGLLGAIEAMMADRARWSDEDVRERASRALQWSHDAGVTRLRTHCDWWEPDQTPVAWPVLRELAAEWSGRLRLERVSLIPLPLFADKDMAFSLAAQVAASGPDALLGGFVHSHHWDPVALRHLLEAAQHHGLDVDLHTDEELNPAAQGLPTTARLANDIGFGGRIVCGHTCALAAQDEATALATLDAVARAPITLVTLPVTNLLLQDATTGRTPRQRGLTLVKEARERGIPVLMASDNVQDPFCAMGSYDPLEAMTIGMPAAQLGRAFDDWSDTLCRSDWLDRQPGALPLSPGQSADLVIFPHADRWGFPSRCHDRVVLRGGRLGTGQPRPEWSIAPARPSLETPETCA